MKRIIIPNEEHVLFSALWPLYESAFPYAERRSLEEQRLIFAHTHYRLEAWAEENRLFGFIGWWQCDAWRFAEHYAIAPEARSSGYGSRFLQEWMKESDDPVVLEIEPEIDDITRRRRVFYHRLGFRYNAGIDYYQLPFHRELQPLKLWLLTWPDDMQENDFQKFYQKLKTEIMPSF